jgi:hypothetical protein
MNTMEHHNQLRRGMSSLWNRNQVNVVRLVRDWCKMGAEYDEITIHSVMGFIDVNSFEIKAQGVE